VSSELSALDNINPALTRYGRKEPAPVLPLREEPDLLSWLETSGRLVEDEESSSPLSWAKKRITTLPMSKQKRIGKIDLRSLP
jgi:hypothetical protein